MKLNRTPNPLDRNARNGENDNWEKIEGSIKRIDDTVSDLVLESGGDSNLEVVQARGGKPVLNVRLNDIESQLAEKANDSEVRQKLNNKRDKSVSLGLNDLSSEVIAAMEGSPSFDLLSIPRKKSVTEEKTTFINVSSNLFDKSSATRGYKLDIQTGEREGDPSHWCTDYFSIDPGVQVIKNTGLICFYDDSLSFVVGHGLNNAPINVPSNAYYARMSALNSRFERDEVQLNYGDTLLPYEPHYKKMNMELIENGGVTSNKQSALSQIAQLIVWEPYVLPDINLSANEITFTKNIRILIGNKRYDLNGKNEKIIISYDGFGAFFYVCFDTETYGFRAVNATDYGEIKEHESVIMILQFEGTPTNGNLLSVYCTSDVTVNGKSFESYKMGNDFKTNDKLYINSNVPADYYVSNELPSANGESDSDFDDETFVANDVYNKLDELVSEYPNYITRELLGKDASGDLDIFKYVLEPETIEFASDYTPKEIPTILIVAGEHGDDEFGDPNTSIYTLYYLLKSICENWEENSVINYLRLNVRLVVIPVANPYGINNKQKYNFNDVDINRNWDYGWSEYAGAEKGNAPFSEVETQYMRDVFLDNKDTMIAYINMHSIGGVDFVRDNRLLRYVINASETGYQVSANTVKEVSSKWRKKYNLDQSLMYYARIESPTTMLLPRSASWVENKHNVMALTLECFLATNFNRVHNSSDALTMNTEHLVNYLINIMRYFKAM